MGKFLFGLILGILIVPLGGYLYFRNGYAPVAASAAPMPFEKSAARMALHARIAKEAPKSSPISADDQGLMAGAQVYRENCAVCHGQPGKPSSNIAKGMFPQPPHLFEDPVTDDPVGQTYWKVANGIRMTGMPGFSRTLSDTQLWQVSLMLAAADKLPAAVQAALAEPLAERKMADPDSSKDLNQPQGADTKGKTSTHKGQKK